MRKQNATALFSAVFLAGVLAGQTSAVTAVVTTSDTAAIRADKLKSIIRRDARAEALFPKVEARAAALIANPETKTYGERLQNELIAINMFGASESEPRLKDDLDLLQAASVEFKPPSAEELKPLQERYAKFVGDMDDLALVKDLERLLKRHDKFIRYTSLGLYDKAKIESELAAMEEMLGNAPDIAFGRAEALRGLQDRRLAAVPKLVYVGTLSHEESTLSPSRRSVGIIDESLGGATQIEAAELRIQNADGSTVDLTTANNPALAIPFSPPLSLWMKTRMVEGRVPVINFRLPANATAQDVLDGKFDDYFKRNIAEIAKTKEAAVIGIFDEFDRDLAANSFGADGRTVFYRTDPKLAAMSPEQAQQEYSKRSAKGFYSTPKATWPELSDKYGDKNIPDGPERVRDAWKRIREAIGTSAPNLAFFSTAGAFHGSSYPVKAKVTTGFENIGNQTWNKLEYYWPGEGVLDWIGVRATGTDPVTDPKGANLAEAIDQFFFEHRSSNWQNTPVVLMGLAPGTAAAPAAEAAWIPTVFGRIVGGTYPNVSMIFVDFPTGLTLWTREANAAYRTNVTSNKAYKWPLRFKILNTGK